MCFLCDVSLSLLEKRSVLKVQKKAVVVESPFVEKERQKKERKKERKKGKRKTKKSSRAVGIRFGFFGQKKAQKKLLSSFSLVSTLR